MYQIKGVIQHYEWGGKTFLPALLNISNDKELPFAEYWLGVHPSGSSTVHLSAGASTSLPSLIQSDKPMHLGNAVWKAFNTLPFLLKVLDVRSMLSIQVHPNKQDAEKGFAREQSLGIPIDAPHRNYKDANHKPEVMIALSEFWLLHGFAANIQERMASRPFLQPFIPYFEKDGIKGLYSHLMEMPQAQVDQVLEQYLRDIASQYHEGQIEKKDPDFWAARAFLHAPEKIDRGIFSIYLFNILRLLPGEAIFQGARMPHAYLEGQNIELMANSDNVLRAGLTPKHMDIPELLANTDFVETIPNIITRIFNNGWQEYPCPTKDFSIASRKLGVGETLECQFTAPSILLILTGKGFWGSHPDHQFQGTHAFYVDPHSPVRLHATEETLMFRASVPL